MDIKTIRAADLGGVLTETRTDCQQYQMTDCQMTSTASIQYEFLAAETISVES